MYRPHCSLSIRQRTLGLLPCFSYCEWGCYEYRVYKYLWEPAFSFFLYLYPEVEFVDNMVNLVFNFGGNYHNVFHSGHAILHFYQWCSRAPCVHASSVMSDSFVTPWTVAHHGISQARILEWVAMSSSRGSSQPRDWTCISCISCTGRGVLYQLSHQGSPTRAPTKCILNCVANNKDTIFVASNSSYKYVLSNIILKILS